MLHYTDGSDARVGDCVRYEDEVSEVEHVIDTEEERPKWQLDRLGLLLNNESFGRVFVCAEDVEFIERPVP